MDKAGGRTCDKIEEQVGSPLFEEEARQPRLRAAPGEPTKAERLRHEATHVPYQPWCKYCVMGRGRRTAHFRKASSEKSDVPHIVSNGLLAV